MQEKQRGSGASLRKPLGEKGLVELENQVVGPVRRGARAVGVGVGKGFGFLILMLGLFHLAGGTLFTVLGDGLLDVLGIVLLVFGTLFSAIGGGSMFLLSRYRKRSDRKEIAGHLFRMMAADGQVTAQHAARVLHLNEELVADVARELEAQGKLERDVDTERNLDVYYPQGWRGRNAVEAFNDPEHQSERRALDEFERELESPAGSAAGATSGAPVEAPIEVEEEDVVGVS